MNRLLSFALVLFVLVSCSEKTIVVGDPQDIIFNGMVDNKMMFEFTIPIENNKNIDFSITQIVLNTRMNNIYLGTINNTDTIVVKKKTNQLYTIHTELTIKNILMAATILLTGNSNAAFSIDGYATVEAGIFKKQFPISYDPATQNTK